MIQVEGLTKFYGNIPGIQNIVIISDPYDIVEVTKLEAKGLLRKGFTINYIRRYLLRGGVAALESDDSSYKVLHKMISPHFLSRNLVS
ncbi:MAG: hypothetical protein VCE91_20915, partial [Nitrospinota bacterium]